jgi:hypothetical protein
MHTYRSLNNISIHHSGCGQSSLYSGHDTQIQHCGYHGMTVTMSTSVCVSPKPFLLQLLQSRVQEGTGYTIQSWKETLGGAELDGYSHFPRIWPD